MWEVKKLTLTGRNDGYPWHASGVNHFHKVPTEFHWSLPDLDNKAYRLSDNADADTRKLFAVAAQAAKEKR